MVTMHPSPSGSIVEVSWANTRVISLDVFFRRRGEKWYDDVRGSLVMPESRPKRRWYHITPDRLIFGLLAVEGFLLLSERFQWFAFNEKKGWTVLIAMAAVCMVVVVMLVWLVVSLLSRWRFQFSVRSLVVLVVAVAVPLGWSVRKAERQRKAVEAIREAGGWVWYDYQFDKSGNLVRSAERPAPEWLRKRVGIHFFTVVRTVANYRPKGDEELEHIEALVSLNVLDLNDAQITDAGLENLKGMKVLRLLWLRDTQITDCGLEQLKGLTELRRLHLWGTEVSDEGMEHLKGMTRLEWLELYDTHVTWRGVREIRQALPDCHISWDGEIWDGETAPTTN